MKYLILIIIMLSLGTNESKEIFEKSRSFSNMPKDVLEHFDKMGVDSSSLLNSYESAYFNAIFEKSRKDFDFTNKKIGFIEGGSKSNKQDFFEYEKDRYNNNYKTNGCSLYIFNASQKKELDGYDAAIVYFI